MSRAPLDGDVIPGTWERPQVGTPEDAWKMADWLAREAYRLGQADDGAHHDTMLEAIRYEIRALALVVQVMMA